MKIIFSIALGVTLISVSVRADDNATAVETISIETIAATNVIAGEETNTVPLKDLMSSNNVVTNTVGTVLVQISPALWAGKFEVTQKEYEKIMGDNPSQFSGADHPVDSVTWSNAMAFCSKLTAKEKEQLPEGFQYSLPTEAQWEMLEDSASLKDAVMKYNNGEQSSTAPVGSLGPNSLGLYDTRGNVMEWCLDSHDPSYHVLRGGGWDTFSEPSTRIAFHFYVQDPTEKRNDFGFRVVLEAGGGQ
jgi:formylglycine-generating enzyme required for sulfatase activity